MEPPWIFDNEQQSIRIAPPNAPLSKGVLATAHRQRPPCQRGLSAARLTGGLGTQFDPAKHLVGSPQSLHRLAAVPLPFTREVLVQSTPKAPLSKGAVSLKADWGIVSAVRSCKASRWFPTIPPPPCGGPPPFHKGGFGAEHPNIRSTISDKIIHFILPKKVI